MPVPSTMSDLSTTAGSNSPAGSEAIGTNLDNYLRAGYALIRQGDALASASIAAASTVDVSAADGQSVSITGAATINSLGTGFNGCLRELRFSGVCTLVHSASLSLPNATNITTAANDVYAFRCTGSGVWTLVGASRVKGPDVVTALGYTPAGLANPSFTGSLALTDTGARFRVAMGGGYTYIQSGDPDPDTIGGKLRFTGWGGSDADEVRFDTANINVNGNQVFHVGNQIQIGGTPASARAALELGSWVTGTAAAARTELGLGSFATKNQTVSTADPSGTPADGDVWLKYTP